MGTVRFCAKRKMAEIATYSPPLLKKRERKETREERKVGWCHVPMLATFV